MRSACTSRRAIAASPKLLLATLFLSLGLSACGTNSCILIVSNPGGGGGTILGGFPNCSLNLTGAVSLRVSSSLAPSAESVPSGVQHVFVTVRGIEANPSAIANEDSPDWRELAPKLATQPVQLDLLARSGDSCEPSISERVSVPADAYRQIRLRLAPNQPDASDPLLEQNSCGSLGFNCIVTSDGNIRPLVIYAIGMPFVGERTAQLRAEHFGSMDKLSAASAEKSDRESQEIQIPPERITGGFFRVLPEAPLNLKIEFNAQSSQFTPADASMRLAPVFTVNSQSPCESIAAAPR
jgi:hypothetical protein